MTGGLAANWTLDEGHCVSPYPGEAAAGDAVVVHWPRSHVVHALLLDVAGHGPAAASVAAQIREAYAAWPDGAAADRLTRCHGLLRGSPGAVGLAVRVDLAAGRIQVAAIGNVAWLFRSSGDVRQGAPGQLGAVCPPLRELDLALGAVDTLVAATDGVRSAAWHWLAGSTGYTTAGDLAREIVRRHQRRHDDAACLVLQLRRCGVPTGA